jgi:hypothetical protein
MASRYDTVYLVVSRVSGGVLDWSYDRGLALKTASDMGHRGYLRSNLLVKSHTVETLTLGNFVGVPLIPTKITL